MPFKELMTWNKARKQWAKKLPVSMSPNPKTIFVGQRKLKKMYPELWESATRDGSRAAANQYWLDLQDTYKVEQVEYDNGYVTGLI